MKSELNLTAKKPSNLHHTCCISMNPLQKNREMQFMISAHTRVSPENGTAFKLDNEFLNWITSDIISGAFGNGLQRLKCIKNAQLEH